MADDIEKRVIELEIKLTHQDRLLDDLNGVVTEQQGVIDKINKRLDLMERALLDLGEDPANEPPPHY